MAKRNEKKDYQILQPARSSSNVSAPAKTGGSTPTYNGGRTLTQARTRNTGGRNASGYANDWTPDNVKKLYELTNELGQVLYDRQVKQTNAVNEFIGESNQLYTSGHYDVPEWKKKYDELVSSIDSQSNIFSNEYITALKDTLAGVKSQMMPDRTEIPTIGSKGPITTEAPWSEKSPLKRGQAIQPVSKNPFTGKLENPQQGFGQLEPDPAVKKLRDIAAAKQTYDYIAGGYPMDFLDSRGLNFYKNFADYTQNFLKDRSDAWDRNHQVDMGTNDATVINAEANLAAENKRQEIMQRRGYGSPDQLTDEEKEEVIATEQAKREELAPKPGDQRPGLFENVGSPAMARTQINNEIKYRNLQREYTKYVYDPDFEEKSKYRIMVDERAIPPISTNDEKNTSMICEQLYDLARIQNAPLDADAMSRFIERSNEIMMILAK